MCRAFALLVPHDSGELSRSMRDGYEDCQIQASSFCYLSTTWNRSGLFDVLAGIWMITMTGLVVVTSWPRPFRCVSFSPWRYPAAPCDEPTANPAVPCRLTIV